MDQNCVRALLLYLSNRLAPTPSGKLPRPVKLRHVCSEAPLNMYAPEDIYAAAQYIVSKGFATISALDPKHIPRIAPRQYVFLSLTAKGMDYLRIVEDDTLWNKIKTRFSNVFDAAIPELVAVAAELGIKLFLG